jgi:uncharacterized repeat protein (TIGR01451 family)
MNEWKKWQWPTVGLSALILAILMLAVSPPALFGDSGAGAVQQESAPGTPGAAPDAATASFILSGRVYEGTKGQEPPLSSPLQNVKVELWCSNNSYPYKGTVVDTQYTNAQGWYGLTIARDACEFYHIIQTNLSGYASDGATTAGGAVKTADWIQYVTPLTGKVLTGNKFWDKSTTVKTATPTATRTRTPIGGQSPTPTATFQPDLRADMKISKTLGAAQPVAPGTTVTYTLMVTNAGPSLAPNVLVTDTLPLFPNGMRCVCSAPMCWGGHGPVPPDGDPTRILWQPGDIPSGAARTADVVCQVQAQACGPVYNQAAVSSDISDPNPANNAAQALMQIGPCEGADLQIAKESTPVASVKPGGTVLYVARVTNNGPSLASNIIMSDVLPLGLAITSLGGGCVAQPHGATTAIVCRLDKMQPGSTIWYPMVWATVDAQACGPILNTMTVSSDTPDPDHTNNSAQHANLVEPCPLPNLRVVKSLLDPPGGVANVGDTVRFQIVVSNLGAAPANGFSIEDRYAEAEFDFAGSAAPPHMSLTTGADHLLIWKNLSLLPGGSLTILLDLKTKLPGQALQNCAYYVAPVSGGGDVTGVLGPISCASLQVRPLDGRHAAIYKKFTVPGNHVAQLGDWLSFETQWLNVGTETASELRLQDAITPPAVSSFLPLTFGFLWPDRRLGARDGGVQVGGYGLACSQYRPVDRHLAGRHEADPIRQRLCLYRGRSGG